MNFKKKMFIISLIVIVFLSISFASAAQNDTQLTDDEGILTVTEDTLQTEETDEITSKSNDENNLTASIGTYSELQNEINEAMQSQDPIINLEKDYVASQGDNPIGLTGDIEINGNDHTIDAGGFAGIFQTKDTNKVIEVLIHNVVFKNGKAERGAAIIVEDAQYVKYIISNCTFINNKVTYGGGAIYFKTGNLEISHCKFINNNISQVNVKVDGGGAIYINGECTKITDSLFENNVAYPADGGAICIDSDNKDGVKIENCVFNNNRVLRDQYSHGRFGGAINNVGKGNLIVRNSNFTNNVVTTPLGNDRTYMRDLQGGAINSDNRLVLSGCRFENNSAFDQGGAVHADVLEWGDSCTFINNHVKTWNIASANKGGAVYASTFANPAKGHIFINNTGYYGGAIYINNKNDITFQSCYFEGNVAMTESKTQWSGAAIYVDSASSTVTMVDNIFYNNKATSDYGIFNCGIYGTVTHNWWGTNDPNFSDGKYIMEWHRIGSNDKISDSNYLKITLSANQTSVYDSPVKLTLKFVCSDKAEFSGKLTNWAVDFTSNRNGEFSDLKIGDNEATVIYTPEVGENVVTAKVHDQQLSITLNQMGDFTWLQQQVDATPSGGTLNLNHNLTYNPDLEMALNSGIKITKPIVINGKGYTISGLNLARIFSIHSNDVEINNITFVNGYYSRDSGSGGGAIWIDGVKNIKILNSKFINNKADPLGGAIAVRNVDNIQIRNTQFLKNTATNGGAIYMLSVSNNITIDRCEFRDNRVDGYLTPDYPNGGAIATEGNNLTISNSIFLNNKALSYELIENIADNKLTLTFVGLENYINAIWSRYGNVKFSNVTYWDGKITTGDNPVYSDNESGQNITLEIFNKDQKLIKKVILVTDSNGQVIYDFSKLEKGSYTYKATHDDDSYYDRILTDGEFNLTKTTLNQSAVKINITDGKEFEWGKCNISFEVTNRTTVDVLITNEDESFYLEINGTDLNYVIADLPASDKEYYICVYNYANDLFDASVDYKIFKILKVNSTVNVNPVSNVNYGQDVSVSFEGDGTSYNVTVYDKNNNIAFTKIVNETAIDIANLPAGEYNVTVVNLGSTNRTQSRASTTFNVNKINNNIKVEVTNGTYGKDITVTVTADVDGDYTVYLNTKTLTVYVENGKGSQTIDDLDAGAYSANVTFDNDNCNNNAVNTTFTIQKAQSHVEIVGLKENITYGTTLSIRFSDFNPYKYNITIYDSGNNVKYTNITDSLLFTLPVLEVGQYTMTVVNLGNDNVIGSNASFIFHVDMNNTVIVYAEDVEYGRELFIGIEADVDGTYTVNLNGTEISIEVENGIGVYYSNETLLNAGDYTTKVTFENPDYTTIVDNDDFTVYPVESNIRIYEIGNVTYGEDIFVKFHENYPTVFNITVYDSKGEVFNTTFVYDDKSPEMQVILADFGVGEYLVVIENLGDGQNIIGNYSSMYFNVTKATSQIVVDTYDVTYPEDVVVIITATVDGNYTVKVANQTQNVTLKANEESHVIFEGLSAGQYVINVTYKETANYTSAFNDSVNVTVNKNDDFDMDIETNETGDITEVNIHFPKDATGNVTVVVKGKGNYTAPIINGTATVYIVNLTDDDEFDVIYSGDENYPAKDKNTTNALLYSELRGSDMTRGYNSGSDYQVTLVDKNGKAVANAQIEFTVNGKKYTALTNANGVAVINPKLAVGTYKVTAYNPFNKQNITKTVKIVTRITGNKNINTYYGKNYQYKLRIIADNGSPVGAGVAVKVTINGKAKTLKTDKNGYITVKFTKVYLPKTYKVTAEYKGIKVSNNIKVKKVLKLKKVKVKRSAKKLKLKATLKEGKKALKGKKVVFKFKGKKYTAKTNKKGVAKVTIKKKVLKKLKKGKKVKYQVTYLKHTVKRTAKVKR